MVSRSGLSVRWEHAHTSWPAQACRRDGDASGRWGTGEGIVFQEAYGMPAGDLCLLRAIIVGGENELSMKI
jgi:hypothetical protein